MSNSKKNKPPEMPPPQQTDGDNDTPDVVSFPGKDDEKAPTSGTITPPVDGDPPAKTDEATAGLSAGLAAENARLRVQVAGQQDELRDAHASIKQLHEAAELMKNEHDTAMRAGEGFPERVKVVVRRSFGDRPKDQHVADVHLGKGLTLNMFVDLVKDGFLKDA